MRTLALVLLVVLCAPAIPVRSAVAQEQPPALAELQRLDRALAKTCERRPDRLDDRERDTWKRRRELLEPLDESQREAFERTSPLDEDCLQFIAKPAEPSSPTYSHSRYSSQSGYSWRRHSYYVIRWRRVVPAADSSAIFAPGEGCSTTIIASRGWRRTPRPRRLLGRLRPSPLDRLPALPR